MSAACREYASTGWIFMSWTGGGWSCCGLEVWADYSEVPREASKHQLTTRFVTIRVAGLISECRMHFKRIFVKLWHFSSSSRRRGEEAAIYLSYLLYLEEFAAFSIVVAWYSGISVDWDEMRSWHGKLFFFAGFVCVLMLTSWHTSKSGERDQSVRMAYEIFGLIIRNLHLLTVFLFLMFDNLCTDILDLKEMRD